MTAKFILTEAAHVEDDIEGLVALAVLGDNIERGLTDRANPFSHMLDKARDAFLANTISLLDADLHTTGGIEMARSHQAEARRYRDLCRWIDDALLQREEAQEELSELSGEEAITEDMKDQYNGRRAKPAHPDA